MRQRLGVDRINSLPEDVREWIHDLQTNADPAGTLAELRLLQDAFKAQELLITELRDLCAAMYQFAGAHDAPEKWLDVLSAAADGRSFSTDGLLPYVKE